MHCPPIAPSLEQRLIRPARARYLTANGDQLPDILVFGEGSRAKKILDRMFACSTDAQGDETCLPRTAPPRKRPAVKKHHSRPKPTLPTIEEEPSLSKSCLRHSDCNLKSDYICAKTSGKVIPEYCNVVSRINIQHDSINGILNAVNCQNLVMLTR